MEKIASAKGVIFDFDGTLADTALDFASLRKELGAPEGIGLLEWLEELELAPRQRAEAIIDRHEFEGAARARLFPGVAEFLELLRVNKIPRAILTRNSKRSTAHALSLLGIEDFAPVLTREEAAPKPDPEGLLKICEAWKLAPSEVIFIGDYLFDLEAGRAAGIPTLLFSPEPRDFEATPDFEFDSFFELTNAWLKSRG